MTLASMTTASPGPPGAWLDGTHCTFRVWAPDSDTVAVRIHADNRTINLEREDRGYFAATVDGITAGARYTYVLHGDREFPDPASRSQPDGVHGSSEVVDRSFPWSDNAWRAPALRDLIIYELHVGTFTGGGTFETVIPHLERLRSLGINAIELLPIAQFPGTRNWGYDGVFPSAVQNSYGGPAGLKRLVDAAHNAGIAVILDVVYNHVGPEGNYLPSFGPYFTDKYKTPWGRALNYDDAFSDEVRAFFLDSASQWIEDFHIDGLRFDAIHAIMDASARPFLAEMTDTLRAQANALGREFHLIAESDLSDPRIITATSRFGLGFDTQWLDDFHHAVHSVVTGETQGYYADYGELRHFATAVERAYVYAGDFSHHRRRRHGAPMRNPSPEQFIVCAQNHDQIGNRLAGDRLSTIISFDALKLVAAATLLSPYIPLLFMGEEYGEESPFPYFVSHGDAELVEAVRNGRKEEFKSFGWSQEPPDPQAESTFRSAVIDPQRAQLGKHRALLTLHQDLITTRMRTPLVRDYESLTTEIDDDRRTVAVYRTGTDGSLLLLLNFGERPADVELDGSWNLLLATDDSRYSAGLASELNESTLNPPIEVTGTFAVAAQSAALFQQETL